MQTLHSTLTTPRSCDLTTTTRPHILIPPHTTIAPPHTHTYHHTTTAGLAIEAEDGMSILAVADAMERKVTTTTTTTTTAAYAYYSNRPNSPSSDTNSDLNSHFHSHQPHANTHIDTPTRPSAPSSPTHTRRAGRWSGSSCPTRCTCQYFLSMSERRTVCWRTSALL